MGIKVRRFEGYDVPHPHTGEPTARYVASSQVTYRERGQTNGAMRKHGSDRQQHALPEFRPVARSQRPGAGTVAVLRRVKATGEVKPLDTRGAK